MNEPRNRWARDLRALRYLDALDAGDLNAVASLWDDASRDAELERILAEIDRALFEENCGRCMPLRPQRTAWNPVLRMGAIGALAAACLMALLLWSKWDRKIPAPNSEQPAQQTIVQSTEEGGPIAALLRARRDLDMAPPMFDWPLPGASPVSVTSLPPNLFE